MWAIVSSHAARGKQRGGLRHGHAIAIRGRRRRLCVARGHADWRTALVDASAQAGLIGRSDDCAVRIEDPSVSRKHAIVTLGRQPRIEDLGESQRNLSLRLAPCHRPAVADRDRHGRPAGQRHARPGARRLGEVSSRTLAAQHRQPRPQRRSEGSSSGCSRSSPRAAERPPFGRDRRRQEHRRQPRSPALDARDQAAGASRLCGASRRCSRASSSATKRSLHRRDQHRTWSRRACGRRHAVSRRGRRAESAHAGQAVRRPREPRNRAASGACARRDRRALHRRNQSRPVSCRRRGHVPARSVLPFARHADLAAAVARAAERPAVARRRFLHEACTRAGRTALHVGRGDAASARAHVAG